MEKLKTFFLSLIGLLILAGPASAQTMPGSLDATFGTGGKVVTPIGTGADLIEDLAIQPDGKIVAVGSANLGGSRMLVARYNANGTFDTSFDGDGWLALQFSATGSQDLYAVALQPDGKIIAAGRAGQGTGLPSAYAIIRLNADGSLDSSFGTGGKVVTQFESQQSQARAVFIQPNGKFVVTGDSYDLPSNSTMGKRSIARYNADGSLDATFDGDGKLVLDLGSGNDPGFGIVVQPDGKIISAGVRSPTTAALDEDFALVRLNVDGSLDATFDGDGVFTTEFAAGAWDRCLSVILQPDGKILAGGLSLFGGQTRGAILRLNPNGTFDTSFDGDGKIDALIGTASGTFYDIALLPNGKIVGGGVGSDGTQADFGAARFNANGSIDTTFGTNGRVVTPIGTALDQAYAMKIAPDGKIVLAGETRQPGFSIGDAALVRYNGDGATRDAIMDFNGDGKTDWAVARRAGQVGPWTLFIRYNGQDNFIAQQWGQSPTDNFQPMDYDGDGRDDIAVWRNNGFFYILNSQTGTFRAVFVGGASGSSAVAADYDGDGKDDPAVFVVNSAAQGPGPGNWCYVASLNNPSQQVTCVQWGYRYGSQSDQVDDPYPGDFDGDGKADFRVQRRSDISNTSSNQPAIFWTRTATGQISYDYFGISSDRILPGDYDGDGKTDLMVARGFNIGTNPPTPINWFLRHSNGQPDEYINFGEGINFNFAQGDYDGDGKDDVALLVAESDPNNPSQRHFWVRPSSNPTQPIVYAWGTTGDLPVAGYNNR